MMMAINKLLLRRFAPAPLRAVCWSWLRYRHYVFSAIDQYTYKLPLPLTHSLWSDYKGERFSWHGPVRKTPPKCDRSPLVRPLPQSKQVTYCTYEVYFFVFAHECLELKVVICYFRISNVTYLVFPTLSNSWTCVTYKSKYLSGSHS